MKQIVCLALLVLGIIVSACNDASKVRTPEQDRELWVKYLVKVADPVLSNTAAGTLKQNMPYEGHADRNTQVFSYLEAEPHSE